MTKKESGKIQSAEMQFLRNTLNYTLQNRIRNEAVSYTHLDVYKRQTQLRVWYLGCRNLFLRKLKPFYIKQFFVYYSNLTQVYTVYDPYLLVFALFNALLSLKRNNKIFKTYPL